MDPRKVYFIFLRDETETKLCWRTPTEKENEQSLFLCFAKASKENTKRSNWFEVAPEDKLTERQYAFLMYSGEKVLHTFPSREVLRYYGLNCPKFEA
ncbi:hypothetical protein ISTM_137 [Insectomime virus]|uniref:Uncharacterized protein n=1 Tax=Tunisvirus fontaine2 TaxID=1421067 RepID=V9SGL0_9VIRU|nr:hypothetical protein D1R32_gp185 [Tunisvirus fontaine2]AHA46035.1 hypothetical protein ISTM_137 [Insectomime virus]AHC54902.1 hypothetical protein TNS_ORF184 [Tunisvirus fontaine2]